MRIHLVLVAVGALGLAGCTTAESEPVEAAEPIPPQVDEAGEGAEDATVEQTSGGPPEVLFRLTDDLEGGDLPWYAAPADYDGDDVQYMADAFHERVAGDLDELCTWVRPAAEEAIAEEIVSPDAGEQAVLAVHAVLEEAEVATGDGLTSLIAGACEVEGRRSGHTAEVHEVFVQER